MTRRFLLSFAVVIVPFGARAEEKPKASVDPQVAKKLVAQLGSDDFETREQAGKHLLELEEAALPALKEATRGSDAELRRSAEELIVAITARVEEKAMRQIIAEVNGVGLDKFVERMVKDKDYDTDEHWKSIARLLLALEKKASEVADRPFRVTKLEFAKMTTVRALPEKTANTARLLLDNDQGTAMGLYNCVVISNGPLSRVGTFNNCLIVVNGDIDGFNVMRNCVVLCRGAIGRTQQIDGSVILATGNLHSANTISASAIEVNSVGRCWKSFNAIYVNQTESPANNSNDDKCVQTKSGPLQLFKWTVEMKK